MKRHPLVDELLSAALFSHRRFDEEFAIWKQNHANRITMPCGKGCAACCSMTAFCSLPEGVRIARKLSPPDAGRLEGEALDLSREIREGIDLKDLLRRRRSSNTLCLFLAGSGECSIYPGRPLACRGLVSTRPSEWCGVDFSTLSPMEKKLFLDSLDTDVVAFPTHYAAYPRLLAQRLEEELLLECSRILGFSLYAPLPIMAFIGHLVWEEGVLPEKGAILSALTARGIDDRFVTDRRPHH